MEFAILWKYTQIKRNGTSLDFFAKPVFLFNDYEIKVETPNTEYTQRSFTAQYLRLYDKIVHWKKYKKRYYF